LLAAAALRETLAHVVDDTFSAHAMSWTAIATQLLVRDGDAIAPACLAVLRETLRRSRLHPELRRAHGADGVPAALQAVLSILGDNSKRAGPVAGAEAVAVASAAASARGASKAPDVVRDALETLAACARWYPGPTRAVTERIRRIANGLTGSPDRETAATAARCLAALPRAAAAAQQDDAFSDAFCLALQGAHATLDTLYAGADERDVWRRAAGSGSGGIIGALGGGSSSAGPADDGIAAPVDELDVIGLDIGRFATQTRVILEMLSPSSSGAGGAVPVPVEAILGLATRCVETDADTLPGTRRGALLLPLLPDVHLLAVEMAMAVVGAARAAVRRHASSVLALATAAAAKRSAVVRSAGFELCADLLREAGPAVSPPSLERLIDSALAAATADDRPDGHDRPKHGGGQAMGNVGGSLATNAPPPTPAFHASRATVCRSALKAIEAAVLVAGAELSKGSRDHIDAFLLNTALAMGRDPPAPYGDARCRLALFRAFRAAVMSAGPGQPTCLPHAIGLCSELLHDDSWEIRLFARESVAMLDQLVRPRTPSAPRLSGAPTTRTEPTKAATASSASATAAAAAQSAWRSPASVVTTPYVGGVPSSSNAVGVAATTSAGVLATRANSGAAATLATDSGFGATAAAASAAAAAAVTGQAQPLPTTSSEESDLRRGDPPKRKWDDDERSTAAAGLTAARIAMTGAVSARASVPSTLPVVASPPKVSRTEAAVGQPPAASGAASTAAAGGASATSAGAAVVSDGEDAEEDDAEEDDAEEDDGLELPMLGDDGPDSDDCFD
jgi:hypothetical protein